MAATTTAAAATTRTRTTRTRTTRTTRTTTQQQQQEQQTFKLIERDGRVENVVVLVHIAFSAELVPQQLLQQIPFQESSRADREMVQQLKGGGQLRQVPNVIIPKCTRQSTFYMLCKGRWLAASVTARTRTAPPWTRSVRLRSAGRARWPRGSARSEGSAGRRRGQTKGSVSAQSKSSA